ncbi:hypothetical protein Godav_028252 [Gossypium davidsonii]|uniref:Peptidase M24 C-terminal domain-containing protein n=1 Tax=Gossypium davidsonii TaxID=34287 RepID=A0A7J8RZG2_GOSDV|nr:hypothetical protein [Gossypium davidsonii]
MDLGEHHKDLELVDNIHKMAVDDVGTTCMKQLKTDDSGAGCKHLLWHIAATSNMSTPFILYLPILFKNPKKRKKMDPHTNNRDGIWSQSNESADESQNEKMREYLILPLPLFLSLIANLIAYPKGLKSFLFFFPNHVYILVQTKLVDLSLLSIEEMEWLNSYHSQVWEKVSPLLEGSARQWLWKNTRPIAKQ